MYRYVSRYSFLILLLLLLNGCGEIFEQPTIEDYGFVAVMGFDYVEDKEQQVEMSIVLPQAEKTAKEGVQYYSTKVSLPYEGIVEMSPMTEKVLSTTQLRVVLFSEELVKEVGIRRLIVNLYRDPQVSANTYVAVAKGSAKEMLQGKYPDKPDITIYLERLLRPKEFVSFNPFTTLHEFIFQLTDPSTDPAAPVLVKENASIVIKEVALFKDDKMVGILEPDIAKLIEAIKKRKVLSNVTVRVNEAEQDDESTVIMQFVDSDFTIKTFYERGRPKAHVHLYIRGNIVDYDGPKNLSLPEKRVALEEEVAEEVTGQLIGGLKKLQALDIDPVGIGKHYRGQQNVRGEWTAKRWREIYKEMELTAHVKVTIISAGTLK